MKNPKLSIVTTSFNQGHFIEQTIKSVVSQTYRPIEFIVVDNCSSDQTHSVLDKYSQQINILLIENDNGPANALNKGFARATGDYFSFINSDDVYDAGFAETAISRIDALGADLVYSDIRFIDENSTIIKPYKFPLAYALPVSPRKLLARACVLPQQGSLWTRRIHDAGVTFNEINMTCWDLEFYVDALCAGFVFQPIHECLASFRLHNQSITGESLFSPSGSINSRSIRRAADHARINQKLMSYGVKCGKLNVASLRMQNHLLKASRQLVSFLSL